MNNKNTLTMFANCIIHRLRNLPLFIMLSGQISHLKQLTSWRKQAAPRSNLVKNGFLILGYFKKHPVSRKSILRLTSRRLKSQFSAGKGLKREYQDGTATHKWMRFEGPFCDICIVRGEHLVALVGARDGTGDRAADKSLRLGTFPSQVTGLSDWKFLIFTLIFNLWLKEISTFVNIYFVSGNNDMGSRAKNSEGQYQGEGKEYNQAEPEKGKILRKV